MGGGAPAVPVPPAAPAADSRGLGRSCVLVGESHRRSGDAQHHHGGGSAEEAGPDDASGPFLAGRITSGASAERSGRPPAVVTSGRPGDGETTSQGPNLPAGSS